MKKYVIRMQKGEKMKLREAEDKKILLREIKDTEILAKKFSKLNTLTNAYANKHERQLSLFFIYFPIVFPMTYEAGVPFFDFDEELHKVDIKDDKGEFPLDLELYSKFSDNEETKYKPINFYGVLYLWEDNFSGGYENKRQCLVYENMQRLVPFNIDCPENIERFLFSIVLKFCYKIDIAWEDERAFVYNNNIFTFKPNDIEW